MADLEKTARALVAEAKGILAADESTGTIKKRFDAIGVESTEENRRAYRDLLFTTEGVEEYISGVILFDETIRQSGHDERVNYRGTLLKPNMVLSGYEASDRAGVDEVAEATLEILYKHVPAAVPGIVFLSGGQTDEDATAHLSAMNKRGPHPWQLSF